MVYALPRPRALYEAIADSLRERIYAHDLAPGTAIDEFALARTYGVSRTPVREALKVLVHEGLLEMRVHNGCNVAELTGNDIRELLELLELLEDYMLGTLVARGGNAQTAAQPDGAIPPHPRQEPADAGAEHERPAASGELRQHHALYQRLLQQVGNRHAQEIILNLSEKMRFALGPALTLQITRLMDALISPCVLAGQTATIAHTRQLQQAWRRFRAGRREIIERQALENTRAIGETGGIDGASENARHSAPLKAAPRPAGLQSSVHA